MVSQECHQQNYDGHASPRVEDTTTLLTDAEKKSTDEFCPSARIVAEITSEVTGSTSSIDETSPNKVDAGLRRDRGQSFARARQNWTGAVESLKQEPPKDERRRSKNRAKGRGNIRSSLLGSLQFGRVKKYIPKSILLTAETLEQRKLANVQKHVRWQDPKKERSFCNHYVRQMFLQPAKYIYLNWLEHYQNFLVALLTYELWAFPVRLALASVGLHLQMFFEVGVDLFFGANICIMNWHASGPLLGGATQQKGSPRSSLRRSTSHRTPHRHFNNTLYPGGRHIYLEFIGSLMMYPSMLFCYFWMLPDWVWRLSMLPRIKRILSLLRYIGNKEKDLDMNNARSLQFVKLLLLIFLSSHYIGCGFYAVSRVTDFSPTSWAMQIHHNHPQFELHSSTYGEKYLMIIYKGFNVISLLGYDGVVPDSVAEMLLSTFFVFGQMVLSAYILGTLFHYLSQKDTTIEDFKKPIQQLEIFMSSKKLPTDLRTRLRRHFNFQCSKQIANKASKSIELPRSIEIKVAKCQYGEVLQKCVQRNGGIFYSCIDQFLSALLICLRPLYLMPGEEVAHEGQMARELMFVFKGMVQVFAKDPVNGNETVVSTVRSDRRDVPTVIGEVAFFIGLLQPNTLRAHPSSDATLLVLSKLDYEMIVVNYPEQHDHIVCNILAGLGLSRDGYDVVQRDEGDENDEERMHQLRKDVQVALQRRRRDEFSRFMFAACNGDHDVVRTLIRRRMDINLRDYDGRSPLHVAAKEGCFNVVRLLLQETAEMNAVDRWGRTPLQIAINHNQGPVAKLLTDWGAVIEMEDPSSALCDAAGNGDIATVRRLVQNRVNPNCGDYDGRTPLHLAAAEGRQQVVEFLMSAGASQHAEDRWGCTPLMDAINAGNQLLTNILFQSGAKINTQHSADKTCTAASTGNIRMLRLLDVCKTEFNCGDYDSRCPMHLAAAEGWLLAVSFLLRSGADPNCWDRWGGTPLEDALRSGEFYGKHCAMLIQASGGVLGKCSGSEEGKELMQKLDGASMDEVRVAIHTMVTAGVGMSGNKHMSKDECRKQFDTTMCCLLEQGKTAELVEGLVAEMDCRRDPLWETFQQIITHLMELAICLEAASKLRSSEQTMAVWKWQETLQKLDAPGSVATAVKTMQDVNGTRRIKLDHKVDQWLSRKGTGQLRRRARMITKSDLDSLAGGEPKIAEEKGKADIISMFFDELREEKYSVDVARQEINVGQEAVEQPDGPATDAAGEDQPGDTKDEEDLLQITRMRDLGKVFQRHVLLDIDEVERGIMKLVTNFRELSGSEEAETSPPPTDGASVESEGVQIDADSENDDQIDLIQLRQLCEKLRIEVPTSKLEGIMVNCTSGGNYAKVSDITLQFHDLVSSSQVFRDLLKEKGPLVVRKAMAHIEHFWQMLLLAERLNKEPDAEMHELREMVGPVSQEAVNELRDKLKEIGREFLLNLMRGHDWTSGMMQSQTFIRCWMTFVCGQDFVESGNEKSVDAQPSNDRAAVKFPGSRTTFMHGVRTTLRAGVHRELRSEMYHTEALSAYEINFVRVTGSINTPLLASQLPVFMHMQFPAFAGQYGITDEDVQWFAAELRLPQGSGNLEDTLPWSTLWKALHENMNNVQDDTICELHLDGGVLNPNHWVLKCWRRCIHCMVIYMFFMVPFRIAFQPYSSLQQVEVWVFETIPDLCLFLDVVIKFNMAYTNKNSLLVTMRSKILHHYLVRQFVTDACAAFPLDMLALWLGGSMRTASILRLLTLVRVPFVYTHIKAKLNDDPRPSTAFKRLLIMLIILLHIFTCIWYELGQMDGDTWYSVLQERARGELDDGADRRLWTSFGAKPGATVWGRYLLTFYWVTATVSTNGGVGSIKPHNYVEVVFTIVAMLVHMTMFTYFLGEISNIVMAADDKMVAAREEMFGVQSFLNSRQLPEELKLEVQMHFHAVNIGESVDDVELTSAMSHVLKVEVAKVVSRKYITDVPLFKDCTEQFLDEVSVLLTERHFHPNEVVFLANEVCQEMFIVVSGELEGVVEQENGAEKVEERFGPGKPVGELSFFFSLRNFFTVRTNGASRCTSFGLSMMSFKELLKHNSRQEDIIAQNALNSLDHTYRDYGLDKSSTNTGDNRSMCNSMASSNSKASILEESMKNSAIKMLRGRRAYFRQFSFFMAAKRSAMEDIQEQLESGEMSINAKDTEGRTLLHVAASEGHLSLIAWLFQMGADPHKKDAFGNTPMNDALRHKQHEAALLIRTHSPGTKLELNDIDAAIRLCDAAHKADIEQIERMVENGVDVNVADYDSRTAMHLAASEGHANVVVRLLELGANVNPRDRFEGSPLDDAIRHNHRKTQAVLVKNNGRISGMDAACTLCQAAADGDMAKLKVLFKCGVDMNAADYDNRTALHLAASNGQNTVLNFLLKIKPALNVNPVDRLGGTPLDDARRHGHQVASKMLQQKGGMDKDDPMMLETYQKINSMQLRERLCHAGWSGGGTQESEGTQRERSGQVSGESGEAGAMASRLLESMEDVRREAEHLGTVGGQGGGTAEARSGGARVGIGGLSQAASSVEDILNEWDDLLSPGPESGVWTQEQSGASPEQAMALAEGGVATLMGASRRVAGLLGGLMAWGGLMRMTGEMWGGPRVELTHAGPLRARGAIPAAMTTYNRRKSVADAQVWMRATQFIILSPLGQRLGILAVAWRHSSSAPAGQPQRGSGGPVRLREQRGGLARGLGGGDMARADRVAGMDRLQAQGDSALAVQMQRGSGGSARLRGSNSSLAVEGRGVMWDVGLVVDGWQDWRREQRGGLARGLGGGDMARAARGAGMNRLQAQGGSALAVQMQRGSGGSARLRGSNSSLETVHECQRLNEVTAELDPLVEAKLLYGESPQVGLDTIVASVQGRRHMLAQLHKEASQLVGHGQQPGDALVAPAAAVTIHEAIMSADSNDGSEDPTDFEAAPDTTSQLPATWSMWESKWPGLHTEDLLAWAPALVGVPCAQLMRNAVLIVGQVMVYRRVIRGNAMSEEPAAECAPPFDALRVPILSFTGRSQQLL
ncbi:hypothetical protein CYMTET_39030 [Cymbomonas tetramitiformis]|uniref:Cyclic nucleotide-binding domain-containing protein n=1 Tax=Cymbomonas tetramitiformis TaxID=36881 RepID=A0AAE0CBZ6_9CHLO|nr:hypothetical protein CYMTET_39030 [Cymbomonas tetramitiformis]